MARGNRGKMLFETDDDHHSNSWTNSSGPRDDLGDPDSDSLTTLTEYLNGSNPRNRNSDGDSKNDAAEIAQGSDPANAADSGAAPTDPPEPVPFHLYGDYTAWEATLKGKGPHDTRTRRFRMSAPNVAADQTLPLLRGNAYELSLRYIRTKPGESVPWYCWETTIQGKSTSAFPLAKHWVVDNRSALLAPHTHSHGTNLVADKKVNLLPVDLDIIHPATGELAEDREDGTNSTSPDGGYVSVKRTVGSDVVGGEDVTPITKLKIHAITAAQPTWKTRIKFSGADRYRIYKNEDRTEEVISEQTEFDAAQTTTLYFQGLKKSLSRGGESITMQIKIGNDWVDGDSVKCTIVQSEFLIQIKAFIPYEWTEGEAVWLINGVNPMNGKVAHGDLRNVPGQFKNAFSNKDSFYSVAPFRLCHEVIMTPYVDLHYFYEDLEAERKFTSALTSDHYSKASSVNASELALRNGYLPLVPPSIATGPPVIFPATYSPELSLYNSLRANKCALNLTASGKDGAMGIFTAASPAIDWDVRLEIDSSSNPLQPSIRVKGKHDLYPAYEIIAIQADGTFKDTHRHMPNRDVYPGPISLSSAPSITFDNTGTITH